MAVVGGYIEIVLVGFVQNGKSAGKYRNHFSSAPATNRARTFLKAFDTSAGKESCFTFISETIRGTLPTHQGFSEPMVDDGDMDMAQVLRTLDEVGYDGIIDYDHLMQITGDKPLPKQYIAFAVGYMRGLLHSLPEQRGRVE